jgi:hypothetical protein
MGQLKCRAISIEMAVLPEAVGPGITMIFLGFNPATAVEKYLLLNLAKVGYMNKYICAGLNQADKGLLSGYL